MSENMQEQSSEHENFLNGLNNTYNEDVENSTNCRCPRFFVRNKVKLTVFLFAAIAVVTVIIVVSLAKTTSNQKTETEFSRDPGRRKCTNNVEQSKHGHVYNESSNPLGEICILGSSEMESICPNQTLTTKTHEHCSHCEHYKRFVPNKCLCDIGEQFPCDRLRKRTCRFCRDNSPCLNGGTYKCNKGDDYDATDHTCLCPPGFEGKYCEIKSLIGDCNMNNTDNKSNSAEEQTRTDVHNSATSSTTKDWLRAQTMSFTILTFISKCLIANFNLWS